MIDEISCECPDTLRISEYHFHIRRCSFTLFDLVFIGSVICTLLIVFFDLAEFRIIEEDLRGSSLIDDSDSDLILY